MTVLHQEHSSPGRVGQLLMSSGFDLDIRRARDLTQGSFAPADAALGLQIFDRHLGRGRRPQGAGGGRGPDLPQGGERSGDLALEMQGR